MKTKHCLCCSKTLYKGYTVNIPPACWVELYLLKYSPAPKRRSLLLLLSDIDFPSFGKTTATYLLVRQRISAIQMAIACGIVIAWFATKTAVSCLALILLLSQGRCLIQICFIFFRIVHEPALQMIITWLLWYVPAVFHDLFITWATTAYIELLPSILRTSSAPSTLDWVSQRMGRICHGLEHS